jgi:hypothetical protein
MRAALFFLSRRIVRHCSWCLRTSQALFLLFLFNFAQSKTMPRFGGSGVNTFKGNSGLHNA